MGPWNYPVKAARTLGYFMTRNNSVLPELEHGVAEKIVSLVNIVKSVQDLDWVLLHAFLESAAQLAETVQRAIRSADGDIVRYQSNLWQQAELRRLIRSSAELQRRIRGLLQTMAYLDRCTLKFQSRDRFTLQPVDQDARHTNDRVMMDMKREIDRARNFFQGKDSSSIELVIGSVRDPRYSDHRAAQDMHDQWEIAETSAAFVGRIVQESGSYRSLDEDGKLELRLGHVEIPPELLSWAIGTSDKRIYCLLGDQGTALAAYHLCVHIHAGQHALRLGGSFFLSRGDEYLETSDALLLSLAYQIRPDARSATEAAIRDYLRHAGEDATEIEPERLLRGIIGSTPLEDQVQTLLVVGGIDQCRARDRLPHLLQYFIGLAREFPWLSVLITLRPEPLMMSVITTHSLPNIIHLQQMGAQPPAVTVDNAERYIVWSLPDIPWCAEYFQRHPRALRQLSKRAGGDPTVASVLVEFLNSLDGGDLHRAIKLLTSGSTGKESLAPLLYVQILRSLSSRSTKPLSGNWRAHLLTILRFIAYEDEGLTPEALAHLAYHRPSVASIVLIVDRLRAVLTITPNRTVVPLHASFRDFVRDPQFRVITQFPYAYPDRHVHLVSVCLAAFAHAQPVTAVFRTPSQVAFPSDYPAVEHPFVSLWPYPLMKAGPSTELANQLAAFSPSVQLALYVWVTRPRDVMRAGEIVARYLLSQDKSSMFEQTCCNFFAFACFVQLKRDRDLLSNDSQSNLSPFEVLQLLLRNFQDGYSSMDISKQDDSSASVRLYCSTATDPNNLTFKVSVEESDMAQYQNILQEFMSQLRRDTSIADDPSLIGLQSGTCTIRSWDSTCALRGTI